MVQVLLPYFAQWSAYGLTGKAWIRVLQSGQNRMVEGAVYRAERRSKKAARMLVFIVIGLFVTLASSAVIALVILVSTGAEACELGATSAVMHTASPLSPGQS